MTAGFRYLRGRPVLQSVFTVDLVAVVFGMPRALFPVLAVVTFAGGAQIVGPLFSAVFRGTILQTNVPDSLRGPMSAINTLVVTGGPRLGDIEAGVVAAVTTPAASVVLGGAMCLVGVAVLALAVPDFVRYRAPG